MPWTEIAIDGNPPNENTGTNTICEITDGTTVEICGWLDDHWSITNLNTLDERSITHWKLWEPAAPPPADGWTPIEEFVPPDALFTFFEIFYDGTETGTNAWHAGRWFFDVPGVTHVKLPTLSDPPA